MHTDLDGFAQRFRRFALQHARPSSPLYAHLALDLAEDPAILRLASQATSSPVTNLFFAAVHYLLLSGAEHPLRGFYPNLTPEPQPANCAFLAFRSFCQKYDDELVNILQTRRVQTNEVRRCLYLALGFDLVAREAGPYSVIDVGASAGLHLLWPRYGYEYEGQRLGESASPVQLRCRFVGDLRPSLPSAWAEPRSMVGIDLHPLDATKPEDQTWLRAMVWPEHIERAELLARALCVARARPPRIVAGDLFSRLPGVLGAIPRDVAACVCHNMTLNQCSDTDRGQFDRMLGELAGERPIYRLSAEWFGTDKPEFVLSRYLAGTKSQRFLARFDDHGAWVQWADGSMSEGLEMASRRLLA